MASEREELFSEIEDNLWSKRWPSGDPSVEEVEQAINAYLALNLDMLGQYPDLAASMDRAAFVSEMRDKYWKDRSVRKSVGHFIEDSDANVSWLPELDDAGKIDWYYWEQYYTYLHKKQHWSKDVCDSIGKDSYNILALTGDPNSPANFKKKGLVVGNVQSGKTANYLGLICRAADAGYKYIIVLAAITEDLRSQTQKRIEEGFIGFKLTKSKETQLDMLVNVGVGEGAKEGYRHPNPGTTRDDDFKKTKMKSLLSVRSENMREPWVFVLKKNTSTLRNLIVWLRQQRDVSESQLFLVDDEADNASINTKRDKDKVSRINGQIRDLLALFPKNVYVGYTATPYANILIDKDDEDEEHGSDLFPRNFIYTLSPADSYFGAAKILADIEPDDFQTVSKPKYIRFIRDIEMMPPTAKDIDIPVLPNSLLEALRTFILASAIRVRRLGKDTHTTMMVNTSPYNPVQEKLRNRIDQYINEDLKPAFKAYGSKPAADAERNSSEIRAIRETWDREYQGAVEFEWNEIYPTLASVVKPLHSALINSKSRDSLDYGSGIEHVVAVGGYRLSRGLTLEGLITSYFSRNSRAYDTLMQMSRWFGHRVGYEDICRIWMTEESAGWCRFVADATDDLIADLIVMQQKKATPLEFGHKIKAHPTTLMVTAKNKMGGGKIIENVSLSGRAVETTILLRDQGAIDGNFRAARELALALEESGCAWSDDASDRNIGGVLFSGTDRYLVERFIGSFNNCHDSMLTEPDSVLSYIGYCADEGMEKWDVLFAAPKSDSRRETDRTFECCGKSYYMQRRSPGAQTDGRRIYVGNRFKVSSRGMDSIGLTEAERQAAEDGYERLKALGVRRVSFDKLCRESRKRPLLVVHHLDIMFKKGSGEYEKALANTSEKSGVLRKDAWASAETSIPALAWSISFPLLEQDRCVEYVFNKTALDSMYFGDDFDDEDAILNEED